MYSLDFIYRVRLHRLDPKLGWVYCIVSVQAAGQMTAELEAVKDVTLHQGDGWEVTGIKIVGCVMESQGSRSFTSFRNRQKKGGVSCSPRHGC